MPQSQTTSVHVQKKTLSLCGEEVRIGFSLQAIQARYADAANRCKLMRFDENKYAVRPVSKDADLFGYITFENGKVSEVERSIQIEEDGNATAFKSFHLLQDFCGCLVVVIRKGLL